MTVARRADVLRWAEGQRLAQRRIAREARRTSVSIDEALQRVDELRRFARQLGAGANKRAEQENLAYHLTWQRVRQAYGLG